MIEDLNLQPLDDLPPELAELDAELKDLRIAERASFEPELKAELERSWLKGFSEREGSYSGSRAIAASIAALFCVGLFVPSVRASLVDASRQLFGVRPEVAAPDPPNPVAPVAAADLDAVPTRPDAQPTAPPVRPGSSDETGEVAGAVEGTFLPASRTEPKLEDRDADQRAIRRYYPHDLQSAGIGGTVKLSLWVDERGGIDDINMVEGSGVPELDRAALLAAAELRFIPATEGDRPIGTRVTFDLIFEPLEEALLLPERVAEDFDFPTVNPMDPPSFEGGDELPASWTREPVGPPAPFHLGTQELLQSALGGGPEIEDELGPLENILNGEPPAGVSPLRWRARVASALAEAQLRDPDNPAPYLALGRIRKRQGLRPDAAKLFDRGIDRASRGARAVSPSLIADLSYERGLLFKDTWLISYRLGRVGDIQAANRDCDRGVAGRDVDRLLQMNQQTLCWPEVDRILSENFTETTPEGSPRNAMLEAFRRAREAFAGHPGANVELLLDLADEGSWYEMFIEARRFVWESQGHPHGLFLQGLALQRLGRSEEAMDDFILASRASTPSEAREFRTLGSLLNRSDAQEMARLADDELERAVSVFWSNLDPILTTEVNEREVEHLARTTYAYLRFGSTRSDAGEVWVRYGRPLSVRALGEGSDLRTEFWDYGRGPDITFRRPAISDDLSLTAEARTYLDDLRTIFPHRYGTSSRTVFVLPAQVGRFRGLEDGTAVIEIHTEVPPLLATGGVDSLDLGVFFLGPGGERLSETRRRIAARTSPVRVHTPPTMGVSQVVLELYNAGTHQAAAVRSTVSRAAEASEDPRISDLLLVEPAAPSFRKIARTDPWVVPRTAADAGSGDALGLLFELYDLPENEGPYRMRVELSPAGSEESLAISYRPSGQMLFGEEWSRLPVDRSGRSTEYLTLDLEGVGPGTYDLRLHVDLPGGREPIEVTRRIERQE